MLAYRKLNGSSGQYGPQWYPNPVRKLPYEEDYSLALSELFILYSL